MSRETGGVEVVRVSRAGRVTVPENLRNRLDIETPGKVLIHEEDDKLVIEPLPSVEEMRGVHAGRYEEGEVLEHLQRLTEAEEQRERDESP
jgi:antitoxin PrlF